MNTMALYCALGVSFFNVLLNYFASKIWASSNASLSFPGGLLTQRFAITFAVGCASLISLCALYYWIPGKNLPRAILLTGAISIVGGSLFFYTRGVVFPKYRYDLSPFELSILVLTAIFLAIRFSRVG